MNPIKQLNEKRGDLIKEADLVIDGAAAEKRALTAAENFRLDKIKSDIFQVDTDLAKAQFDLARAGREHLAQSGNLPDMRSYSITRAIQLAGQGRLDGLEGEISNELSRRSGKSPAGFFLPHEALMESRAMTVTSDGGIYGSATVATQIQGLLDALRPACKVISAGATVFSNLISNLSFPRQVAASNASWKAENAALDSATSEIEQVSLQPNRIGAYSELSNQLLAQSSSDIEQFVRRDLLGAIAGAIDEAALIGTGQNNQPLGLLTAGSGIDVTSVVGGSDGAIPKWSNITGLVGALEGRNSNFGALGFIINAKTAAALRSTQRVSGTDSRFILEGNTLLDFPVNISNNAPCNLTKGGSTSVCSAIVFGNWSDLLIGSWGAASDIIVDRLSLAVTGYTRIVIQTFADVAIRRSESFAAMLDALTA